MTSSGMLRGRLNRADTRRFGRRSATRIYALVLAASSALSSCASPARVPAPNPPAASPVTSKEALLGHIRVLASDAFEGRGPGTVGEERTTAYVARAFASMGLKAPFERGGYLDPVPLVGIISHPTLTFDAGGSRFSPSFPDDFVALSKRATADVDTRMSSVVFVGYGVQAPEYGWDDIKGEDLHGKMLVMLVGDPPVPDPKDPTRLDPAVFGGSALTYYGRWTYKYEQASRLGAAAVLLVHETGPAGYPYGVVRAGGTRENIDLDVAEERERRVAVEGWLSRETAVALFQRSGADFEALKRAAARRDFRPVSLTATAQVHVRSDVRSFRSHNVVGVLEGTDPAVREDVIVYAAHWDHLGRIERTGASEAGAVAHGAIDNASGVAELIEIARTLKARLPRPRRTFVFLSPTAEESGLLGARHYTAHPVAPLERTLAEINLDMMNVWGKTRSIVSIARGRSTLDRVLADAAREQGRGVIGDPEPEKGYFYRSDNFEFAKRGIPVLSFLRPGADYVNRSPDFGAEKTRAFIAHDYHRPTDEVRDDWDLTGAVDDVELLARVGALLDAAAGPPEWNAGSEFGRPARGGVPTTTRDRATDGGF